MKFLVVAVLAVASVAQAYDFSDPDFNALLAEDFVELMAEDQPNLLNHRSKREACHGHKKEFPSQRCCNQAIEKGENMEKVKEFKKECFSQVKENRTEKEDGDMFSCEWLQNKKSELRCGYECVYKKQSLFLDNGEFDEKATAEYFVKELADLPWVQENVDAIVTGCLAERAKETNDAAEKCSAKPMKFSFCLWREFTKKCPADQQKDTKTCNLIREGKLEFVHHQGHHHHHHD